MDHPPDTLLRFANKAEFLAWEEQQETRFEFDGEDVTEVNGGTLNHILIVSAIDRLLYERLIDTPFLVWQQVKVETIPGYRYPDIAVGRRDAERTRTILPDPIVLFEVLSPSTARVDLGRKHAEYGQIVSVRRYVLIESLRIAARMLARAPDGTWIETALDAAGVLDLPEIGVTLPLAALYRDVRF